MPKTITDLSVYERVRLMDVIGAQEASGVAAQRELMRLLDVVEFSADIRERLELTIDAGKGFVSWNPDRAMAMSDWPELHSVTLTDNQAALLAAILSNDGGRYRVALKVRGDEWAGRVLDIVRGGA